MFYALRLTFLLAGLFYSFFRDLATAPEYSFFLPRPTLPLGSLPSASQTGNVRQPLVF
jgi:hypothetical protein